MWIIGLAVSVTASYIIGVVVAAPALIMFKARKLPLICSSSATRSSPRPPPPPFAFCRRRPHRGSPYKTTMIAWKYSLPAFIVPFMFTLHPDGVGDCYWSGPAP